METPIDLQIKTLSNEVYSVNVYRSTTISALKECVKRLTSIEEERQRLIYRGRVLEDDHPLTYYQIEDGHVVHLVSRPANFRELPRNEGTEQQLHSQQANRSDLFEMEAQSSSSGTLQPPPEESASLQHIHQGLMTMRTLLSTIPPVDSHSPAEPSSSHSLPARNRQRSQSNESTPSRSPFLNCRQFYVGQWVDVKDTVAQWLEATIMSVREQEREVYIHYNGWPIRWDEWLPFDSPRIAPFRTRTTHTTQSTTASPVPVVFPPHAPTAGNNDPREIIPDVVQMLRQILPLAAHAAECATMVAASQSALSSSSSGQIATASPPTTRYRNSTPAQLTPSTPQRHINNGPSERMHTPNRPGLESESKEFDHETSSNVQRDAVNQLMLRQRLGRSQSEDEDGHLSREEERIRLMQENAALERLRDSLLAVDSRQRATSVANDVSREETTRLFASSMSSLETARAATQALSEYMTSNLLSNRPGSPPPDRAYRSLVSTTPNSNGLNNSTGSNSTNYLDIHIAVLSPPRRPSVDTILSQAVASLQAQSQTLAQQQARLEMLRQQQILIQQQHELRRRLRAIPDLAAMLSDNSIDEVVADETPESGQSEPVPAPPNSTESEDIPGISRGQGQRAAWPEESESSNATASAMRRQQTRNQDAHAMMPSFPESPFERNRTGRRADQGLRSNRPSSPDSFSELVEQAALNANRNYELGSEEFADFFDSSIAGDRASPNPSTIDGVDVAISDRTNDVRQHPKYSSRSGNRPAWTGESVGLVVEDCEEDDRASLSDLKCPDLHSSNDADALHVPRPLFAQSDSGGCSQRLCGDEMREGLSVAPINAQLSDGSARSTAPIAETTSASVISSGPRRRSLLERLRSSLSFRDRR